LFQPEWSNARIQEYELMPFRVLVVNADPVARSDMERMLSSAGNLVTSVAEFAEAQHRLVYAPPDLLVTSVRLGTHNGLHLVLRAHAEHPDTPAIVVHSDPDPVLENEAMNAGAAYLTTPLEEEQFVSLVEELLSDSASQPSSNVPRRWPRKQVELYARVGKNVATVVDVSYGGLRLEIGAIDHPISRLATIDIPSLGALPVNPVWARGGGSLGRWWCGAEVDAADQQASDEWRRFVDSLH
jgi:CheY-like chemotaxis protein